MNIPVVTNGGWGDVERMSSDRLYLWDSTGKFTNVMDALDSMTNQLDIGSLTTKGLSLNEGVSLFEEIYFKI